LASIAPRSEGPRGTTLICIGVPPSHLHDVLHRLDAATVAAISTLKGGQPDQAGAGGRRLDVVTVIA